MGPFWLIATRASSLSLSSPRPPVPRWASHRQLRRLAGRMCACEWWMLAATSAVTSILYALLLLTLYIMLSRKIARHSCGMRESGSPAVQPQQPHASPAGREGPQAQTYTGSSETSSETSEDSDSSPSCPQGPCAEENLNYTCLVFPGEGSGPSSTRDYENMKPGPDYINVDPKKRKVGLWPCSSPVASKSIEYTEVKL